MHHDDEPDLARPARLFGGRKFPSPAGDPRSTLVGLALVAIAVAVFLLIS